MEPIIVLGAGLAGWAFVREFRKLEPDVPLTLICADSGDYYSKPDLSAALGRNKRPEDLIITPADAMAKQYECTLMSGHKVTKIDPKAKCVEIGEFRIHYDHLVLALGAHARQIPGIDSSRIHSINDLDDYQKFIKSLEAADKPTLSVIGSGLIACEFVCDLVESVPQIDIYSIDAYPLARFVPPEMGKALQEALANKGVKWHLKQSPESINTAISQADLALSAIGLEPNLHLAREAGLKTDIGILANAFGTTSDPFIHCLGDCAQIQGLWVPYIMPITYAARHLSKTLTGTPSPIVYPTMPIIVKTPLYPITIVPPRPGESMDWTLDTIDGDLQATSTHEGKINGYILSGKLTRTAMMKAKGLNDWLP